MRARRLRLLFLPGLLTPQRQQRGPPCKGGPSPRLRWGPPLRDLSSPAGRWLRCASLQKQQGQIQQQQQQKGAPAV